MINGHIRYFSHNFLLLEGKLRTIIFAKIKIGSVNCFDIRLMSYSKEIWVPWIPWHSIKGREVSSDRSWRDQFCFLRWSLGSLWVPFPLWGMSITVKSTVSDTPRSWEHGGVWCRINYQFPIHLKIIIESFIYMDL